MPSAQVADPVTAFGDGARVGHRFGPQIPMVAQRMRQEPRNEATRMSAPVRARVRATITRAMTATPPPLSVSDVLVRWRLIAVRAAVIAARSGRDLAGDQFRGLTLVG